MMCGGVALADGLIEVQSSRFSRSEKESWAKLKLLDHVVFEGVDSNPDVQATPAYLFGRSDAEWAEADFLIAEQDKSLGENAYKIYWDNVQTAEARLVENALDHVLVNADSESKFDAVSYRDEVSNDSLGVELVGSIPSGVLVREDGAELSERIVWFLSPNSGADEFVVASIKELSLSFELTRDGVSATAPVTQTFIHPIIYVMGDSANGITGENVAQAHAELLTMTGVFSDATPVGDGVAQSSSGNDDGGDDDEATACNLQHGLEWDQAMGEFESASSDCEIDLASNSKSTRHSAYGCCAGGAGVGGTIGAGVGSGAGGIGAIPGAGVGAATGCVVGLIVCWIPGVGDDITMYDQCKQAAHRDFLNELGNARTRREICCIGIEDCLPLGVLP